MREAGGNFQHCVGWAPPCSARCWGRGCVVPVHLSEQPAQSCVFGWIFRSQAVSAGLILGLSDKFCGAASVPCDLPAGRLVRDRGGICERGFPFASNDPGSQMGIVPTLCHCPEKLTGRRQATGSFKSSLIPQKPYQRPQAFVLNLLSKGQTYTV